MGRARPRVSLVYPAARPIQMRDTDPETGKQVRVSTGTRDPVKAEEERERLQAKLILGMDVRSPKKRVYGPTLPWEDFRDEYSRQHLSTLRLRSRNDVEFRLDMIGRIRSPPLAAVVMPLPFGYRCVAVLNGRSCTGICRSWCESGYTSRKCTHLSRMTLRDDISTFSEIHTLR